MLRTLAATAVLVASTASAESLTYTFTPNRQRHTLQVELDWQTQGRTESGLRLMQNWGGVSDVSSIVRNVAFTGRSHGRGNGREWRVRHQPGETISLRYEVDSGRRSLEWDGVFRPTVTTDFFIGVGTTFLLSPEVAPGTPREFDVVIRWNLPRGWTTAACPLGVGPTVGGRVSNSDLLHSVYYAGKLDMHAVEVLGQPVTVVMPAEAFDFSTKDLATTAAAIVKQQRTFMDESQFPPFLVTAAPTGEKLAEGATKLQGTTLYRSFALFVPPGAKLNDAVEHLFAHELFHYWNGRILEAEEPEGLVYWFTEGLTDYYALRILFESGHWDAKRYASWINKHLADYRRNPDRNATNAEIERSFWSKRETVGEAAYQRGLLLGLRWHKLAREQGVPTGLDRLFTHLVERGRAGGFELSNRRIREAGVETLGDWLGDEFDKYVANAAAIEVPADALAPRFEGELKPVYEFALGFDREGSLANKRVQGLVPGAAGDKAGLQNGDELIGWSIISDPDKPTVLEIRRDGRRKTIRFFPRGASVQVMQFKPSR